MVNNMLKPKSTITFNNIVYICKKPLHANSRHTKFASALAEMQYNIFYISPLRIKDYILHKLKNSDSAKMDNKLNYNPYLRISQKFKSYEVKKIVNILHQHKLISHNTYVVSADMAFCHYLKKYFADNIKVVYYIIDRYSEYDNLSESEKVRFDQKENTIIKECDLILCASHKLLSEAKVLNSQAYWLPNAVPDTQITTSQAKENHRTIGMISDELSRIDWSLICEIAQRLEHYTIELIGTNDLPAGTNYPKNIHVIGYVPFKDLGRYANKWSAGLALYEKNRFNEYCCPLKYFEYSSFAIPTISTPIPEAKVWADLYPNCVYLADNAAQIAERLYFLVNKNQFVDYTQLAKENTWTIRAQQLCTILAGHSLEEKYKN